MPRWGRASRIAILWMILGWMVPGLVADEVRSLSSPDGRIRVSVRIPVNDVRDLPHWEASLNGRSILRKCGLGLESAGGGEMLAGIRVIEERRRSVDERVPVSFGRASMVRDRFQELLLAMENGKGGRVDVVFRCFDDAVALRYEVPEAAGTNRLVIVAESTSFEADRHPTALVQYLEHHRTSHEHAVETVSWDRIRPGTLLDMPLTLVWDDGTCVAITEGALRRYAGMALMRPLGSGSGGALVAQLTPRPDGAKVVRPLPMKTPWRVALIGDRMGALLESGTLHVLNEPTTLGDTSWIKPGKITFHWWNGDVFDGRPGLPILSTEMAARYVDFCASNGIAAHSMTSTEGTTTPWYWQSKPGVEPGPDTDVTRPREGFDLPAIRRYAESKGVRLWTWVHQGALRGRVEEAFTAFGKMGWSGMMVDFFDHDDQETVEFAEAILESAARHRILIHLHGVWKPTGLERTYPNLMNHEAALNLEYLKWSDRCTPAHDLGMAFTRLIAGPMDYHLGGFRAVSRADFQPRNVAPLVLGTRAHMLAMYLCYDNPTPMVADYPEAYRGQTGFEFLQRVPTWWDETRVVTARLGEVLVTARRRGETWYLGGLAAKPLEEVSVPMTFLGAGRYRAVIWRDGDETASDPNRVEVVKAELSTTDTLRLRIADGGGFVAELVRADGLSPGRGVQRP